MGLEHNQERFWKEKAAFEEEAVQNPEYQELHPLLCTNVRMTYSFLWNFMIKTLMLGMQKSGVVECIVRGLVNLEKVSWSIKLELTCLQG